MCGVVGLIDPGLASRAMAAQLQQMTTVIQHRGPDDWGHIAGDGCGIAMRRLSIIDVAGGHQPIANETGDVHVVCNGEIYNFVDLRDELRQQGHRFRTGSDTEVIVHLYEQYGDDCFSHLRGMFGIAIWDQRRDRVLIARDRVGKKPLYYAQAGDRFLFGSEMKSLLAVEPGLSRPDYTALGELLQFGYLHDPGTIYQDIHQLPPGHFGVFEDGRFTQRSYWSVSFEPDESRDDDEWIDELHWALMDAVRVRLRSDVPLGVFLSGGLDSSAIVAYAHAAGLDPIKTFTIGFDRRQWDESSDAKRVADHFGTDHHLLRLNEADLADSFEATLRAVIHHCDEPFADSSAIPAFHVARLAREHVTVALSGDGGDELFGGYVYYFAAMMTERYQRLTPRLLTERLLPGLATKAAGRLPGAWSYRSQRVARVLRDLWLPEEAGYRNKRVIWKADEVRGLLTGDVLAQSRLVGEQFLPDHLWDVMTSDRDILSRLTEIDVRSKLVDDILVKVDRTSMAHSLEVRSPLLDHHIVELAARMPARMKIRHGRGKRVLRDVTRPRLPPQTLRKGKQGFAVPLRDWFRGQLRDLTRDMLLDETSLPSSIFSGAEVKRILDEHDEGLTDHSGKIWSLLTFATWHQDYQVNPALAGEVSVDRPKPLDHR